MAALVRDVGLAHAASYSLKLQTAKPPYEMTIYLTRPAKPIETTDFSGQATLLLGLIANLDKVSISTGNSDYALTTAAASQHLGYNVKRLGLDRKMLVGYLHQASD